MHAASYRDSHEKIQGKTRDGKKDRDRIVDPKDAPAGVRTLLINRKVATVE